MSDIPEITMKQIGVAGHPNGRSMGMEVRDEKGQAVRLWTEAANTPALVKLILDGAQDTLGTLPQGELLRMVAAGETTNLIEPIQAIKAKAVMNGATSSLMLHLGAIALQFELPTEELRSLAQEIEEQG